MKEKMSGMAGMQGTTGGGQGGGSQTGSMNGGSMAMQTTAGAITHRIKVRSVKQLSSSCR